MTISETEGIDNDQLIAKTQSISWFFPFITAGTSRMRGVRFSVKDKWETGSIISPWLKADASTLWQKNVNWSLFMSYDDYTHRPSGRSVETKKPLQKREKKDGFIKLGLDGCNFISFSFSFTSYSYYHQEPINAYFVLICPAVILLIVHKGIMK